jgi:predicted nuclease of predicted toxin-antitoxin system
MSLKEFSFLTDENIDIELLVFLRNQGFDVFDIKEEKLFATSDKDILELAYQTKRIVISQDSDFGTLVFRDNLPFWGIIYLRPGHAEAAIHIQTMENLLETDPNLETPFMIVAENYHDSIKFRIRLL